MADSQDIGRDRVDYLCECAVYAREQILFHTRHRDQWLMYQSQQAKLA